MTAPRTPQTQAPDAACSISLDPAVCGQKEEAPAAVLPNALRGIYKLPRSFYSTYIPCNLGAEAIRLLHAVLYLTCRDRETRSGPTYQPPLPWYMSPTDVLRDLIGPKLANDTRAIRMGIAQLRSTHLFTVLELRHSNRLLTWQLDPEVLGELFYEGRYGLIDVRTIGVLRRELPIHLYTWISMVRAMRRPRFDLDVEQLWVASGRCGTPCWTQLSRGLLGAIQSVAVANDLAFVLQLNWRGRLSGVDEMQFNILHAKTEWTPKVLCKADPCGRAVLVVTATGLQRYKPKTFTSEVAAALCRLQAEPDKPRQ